MLNTNIFLFLKHEIFKLLMKLNFNLYLIKNKLFAKNKNK